MYFCDMKIQKLNLQIITKTIFMKKLLFLFLMGGILFTSCEKPEDDDPVIPDPPLSGELTQDIIRDTTFKLGVYVIDGTIRVRNAVVTIEPGVVFKFTDRSAFDVAYWGGESASIIAKGTKDKPILFTSNNVSPQNNSWDGFRFYQGTNNTVFEYCTFEYGGGSSTYSMVYMNDAPVAFTNCTFQKCSGIAIEAQDDAYFTAFDKNYLAEIESYPMSVYSDQVHTITGANTYETSLGILIPYDRDFRKKGEFTWTNQGVPYYSEGTIRFGSEGSGTVLHIDKGCVFRFLPDAQWDIAYWGSEYATIIADGTADEPILFTSANVSPSAGDWASINLFGGTINSSMNHCIFEYAGGNYHNALLLVEESSVGVTNCTFRKSAVKGINMGSEALFTDFGGNTFENNDSYAISIFPNYVNSIIGENSYDGIGILIIDDGDLNIKGDFTWTNQGIPYTVEGNVRIGSEVPGTHLTIEPGTVIKFYEDAKFEIAYWGAHYGSFVANGTDTEPIIFTSAKPVPNKGDWMGILFYEGSSDCIINHCRIEYAGGNYNTYGAIYLSDAGAPLTLGNTVISNSYSNGISVDADNNGSSVDYSNNVSYLESNGVIYYVR